MSNANTNTNETVRDIAAEIRSFPEADKPLYKTARLSDDGTHYILKGETLRSIADRIEAAAERERSKWERERRAYEKLHDCFWEGDAIQNIVRQMLGARDDLRRIDPKEADDLDYYAHELMKAAKKREQVPAEGPSSGTNPDAETRADILREMRTYFQTQKRNWNPEHRTWHQVLSDWADRIEAAAELEAIRRDKTSFHCGDCAKFGCDCDAGDVDGNEDFIACEKFVRRRASPGNSAAMREALEEQLLYWDSHIRTRDEEEMRKRTEAALAAPARNCDRTKDEAEELFKERFGRPWTQAEDELAAWLFAKAEGKEASNG